MARSAISNISNDLQSDSGGILFSIIQGEQLEFPVTISFIENSKAIATMALGGFSAQHE